MGTSPAETPKPDGDSGTHDRRAVLRRNVVDSHLVTVDLAFQTGALVLDLSETGMGVQALSSAPMGATTTLQFDLPETGGHVDAVGRIAWTDSSGRLGIRFEEIAELSRVHLAQWLTSERRPVIAPGAHVAIPTWPPPYVRDEIAALRRDLITEKLEGDSALAFVVERVRNVTRATGAAIALEDGSTVVCRASSGNAPAIGARLDPNSGLSGECMRTGEIVRCEDTETDPRADRLICRKLELRSIVIVPIRVQGRPAGVLEAFSPRAHAFQSSDVLLLRRFTDLVAGIAVRQPELTSAAITGPQGLMAAVTLEPPVREPESETPLMMEDILENEVQDATPSSSAIESDLPPRRDRFFVTPQAASRDSLARAEPIPAPPEVMARLVERQAPPAVIVPVERRAQKLPVEAPEELRAPTPPMERSVPPVAIAAVEIPEPHPAEVVAAASPAPPAAIKTSQASAVITPRPAISPASTAMGAAATAATAKITSMPVQTAIEEVGELPNFMRDLFSSQPQVPSPWRLRITGGSILVAVLVVGGWQVWRTIAPPKGTPMDSEVKQRAPVSNTPDPVLTSTAMRPLAAAVPAPAPPPVAAPAAKSSPARSQATVPSPPDSTRVLSSSSAAGQVVTIPAPVEEAKNDIEPPPAMGLQRNGGTAAISSVLSVPVATPKFDRPPVSEMTGGKLIRKIDPIYPRSEIGLRGEVVLKAMIDKKGDVSKVRIVSGQALLAQAAARAVRRWRYEPFRLNGVPIEIENTIVVNFKAPGQ